MDYCFLLIKHNMSSSTKHSGNADMKAIIPFPLFEKYQVDIVLQDTIIIIQRTIPVNCNGWES